MRVDFPSHKAEEEGGLTPADDENTVGWKMDRKNFNFLMVD